MDILNKINLDKAARFIDSIKMPQVVGIFLLLVACLFFSPKRKIQKIVSSILGRICLVGFVVFFARHNMLMGIAFVLIIIFSVQYNMKSFVIEGMESMTPEQKAALEDKKASASSNSIKNGPNDTVNKILQSADEANVAADEANVAADEANIGVDKQAIHESIQAKPSNTLPVGSTASSDNVSPSTANKSSFSLSESFI